MSLLDRFKFAGPRPQNTPRDNNGRPPGRPMSAEGEDTEVTGEGVSYAGFAHAAVGGVTYYNCDEILRRKGWREYETMRHDDQVKLALAFKKILVYGRTYDILPADQSEKAKEIAKFVEWSLKRVNFKQMLREALTAIDFGFSIGEIVWETALHDGNRVLTLKDVKHRHPGSWQIFADMHGNLTGFEQLTNNGRRVLLKPEKAWHYAHQREFSNHYGVSDLRAAYRPWWAKRFIINFWNVFLERMAAPMTAMKYPAGADEKLKTTLKSILQGLSAKTEVMVPAGVEIELIEATRSGSPEYGSAVDYCDRSIMRAVLIVAILGAGGDDIRQGSDSQSHLHLRLLFKMAQELGYDLIESFMCQVVKPMIDMNYEHDGLYPRFVWQDYGEFEGVKVADTIRLLFAAGILDMDQADVNYARSILGLPVRGEDDPEDDVVRPQPLPPPGNANAPPPPASQGNDRAGKGDSGGKTKAKPTKKGGAI